MTKRFIQACELPSNDPLRRSQILRSLKWYITQVIFRKPNRDKDRSVKIVNFRLLRQFLSGNYRDLLTHWFKDVKKERASSCSCSDGTMIRVTPHPAKDS